MPPPQRCPRFLVDGTCSTPSCPLEHVWRKCNCGTILLQIQLEAHLPGKVHRKKLAALQRAQANEKVQCVPCETEFPSAEAYALHVRTDGHIRALQDRIAREENILPYLPPRSPTPAPAPGRAAGPPPVNPAVPNASNPVTLCDLFKIVGNEDPAGDTATIDFGVVEVDNSLRTEESTIRKIQLKASEGRFNLLDVSFVSPSQETATAGSNASFTSAVLQQSRVVRSNQTVSVMLRLVNFDEGLHKDKFEITVQDFSDQTVHPINLVVRAVVGSKADYDILNARRRHARQPVRLEVNFAGPTVRVGRPAQWTATKWKVKLPHYAIPEKMQTLFDSGKLTKRDFREEFMPGTFNTDTYSEHFRALTFLSELDERRRQAKRGLKNILITHDHPYYWVPIPDLAERKPKPHVGDFIRVKKVREPPEAPDYQGRIHRLERSRALVVFNDKFRVAPGGERFDVQFTFNTMPYRRQHRALEFASRFPRFLFPSHERDVPSVGVYEFSPALPDVLHNPEQLRAVRAIVTAQPGSAPFIIFGPPGTGKTSTVVETIHQLLAKSPDVRILACTPQNAAADHLAIRLITGPTVLDNTTLFRLNALWRGRGQDGDIVDNLYPEILDPYSEINDDNVFANPTKEKLESFRVVVATCTSAGVAEGLGLPRGHFTHIIVDEAGQSVEPVTMAAIFPLADEHTNVVLAGDKHQLGPPCYSQIAKSFGLGISYMERLMNLPAYNENTYTGVTIVKLRKNFRNHPAIVHFSNEVFYDGELLPMGNPDIRMFEDAPFVNNKFPVIFHSVVGEEKKDKGSFSYYNNSEAIVVKRYCQELIDGYEVGDRTVQIGPEDIGIISPYHAQRYAIGDLCRWEGLKIGTVESFQGQERRVIIVSAVRTQKLGFIKEPRRLNVALTRARALLIIVGNPLALADDPYWRTFLQYANQHAGWIGKPRASDVGLLSEDTVRTRDDDMVARAGRESAGAQADAESLLTRLRSVVSRFFGTTLASDER